MFSIANFKAERLHVRTDTEPYGLLPDADEGGPLVWHARLVTNSDLINRTKSGVTYPFPLLRDEVLAGVHYEKSLAFRLTNRHALRRTPSNLKLILLDYIKARLCMTGWSERSFGQGIGKGCPLVLA